MTYIARTRATFAHALSAMLPEGPVWPRDLASTLQRFLAALAEPVARWAIDCGVFLMREAFPPRADLMLRDWERVLGLPEECIPYPTTFAGRQAAVAEKLARRPGAQSRAYFVGIASRLGYHEPDAPYQMPVPLPLPAGGQLRTTIKEFRPFMAGVSRCGYAAEGWAIAPPATPNGTNGSRPPSPARPPSRRSWPRSATRFPSSWAAAFVTSIPSSASSTPASPT